MIKKCLKNTTALFTRFGRDREATFAPLFGLTLLPMVLGSAMLIEYGSMTDLKEESMNAADTALMAAAVKVRDSSDFLETDGATGLQDAEWMMSQAFESFFKANLDPKILTQIAEYQTHFDSTTDEFVANLDFSYQPDFFGAFFSGPIEFSEQIRVKIDLARVEYVPALSMMLILDDSGSMGWWVEDKDLGTWYTRTEALQAAMSSLMDHFERMDPTNQLIRTGVRTYASSNYNGKKHKIHWDQGKVRNIVNNHLRSSGSTYAEKAMKWGFNQIKHSRELKEHQKKSGNVPKRALVLMSDGVLHDASKTHKVCKQARDANIEVYTVAFLSYGNGEEILKQCSKDESKHFFAKDATELIAAFSKIGEETFDRPSFTQ
ncbi:MAG: vWA domain-containing protein [Pseudomonadota bacterium]